MKIRQNDDLLGLDDAIFAGGRVALLELSTAAVDGATRLRAKYGFKTPDALHLAGAVECGAAGF